MKLKQATKTLIVALMGWTIMASALSVMPHAFASGPGGGGGGGGGGGVGGNPIQTIANGLRGPWESLVVDTILTVNFNNNGTFTATIQSSSGPITTDSGLWKLTAAVAPQPFSNPQAHLTITDSRGIVLLSGDVLMINNDQLAMFSATDGVSPATFVSELVLTKFTP